jgi:hypothetical protein
MFPEDFAERCLPYDLPAAVEFAEIVAVRTRHGKPISVEDGQIAGSVRSAGLTLATHNIKDFSNIERLPLVNPWAQGAQCRTCASMARRSRSRRARRSAARPPRRNGEVVRPAGLDHKAEPAGQRPTAVGLAVRPTALCEVVRPAGLEPATLGLEGRCSIQLSYGRTRSGS